MSERNNKMELLGSAPIPKGSYGSRRSDYDWYVD